MSEIEERETEREREEKKGDKAKTVQTEEEKTPRQQRKEQGGRQEEHRDILWFLLLHTAQSNILQHLTLTYSTAFPEILGIN